MFIKFQVSNLYFKAPSYNEDIILFIISPIKPLGQGQFGAIW